jgi:hypothetical protein
MGCSVFLPFDSVRRFSPHSSSDDQNRLIYFPETNKILSATIAIVINSEVSLNEDIAKDILAISVI